MGVPSSVFLIVVSWLFFFFCPCVPDSSVIWCAPDGCVHPCVPDSSVILCAPDGCVLPCVPDSCVIWCVPDSRVLSCVPDSCVICCAPDSCVLSCVPDILAGDERWAGVRELPGDRNKLHFTI